MNRLPRSATGLSLLVLLSLVIGGCRQAAAPAPTPAALAIVPTETAAPPPSTAVPPTWTPGSRPLASPSPIALAATRTPRPTNTPWPTRTLAPTATPLPTATPPTAPTLPPALTLPPPPSPLPPTPTVSAPPPGGANLLPNGSFESGWFNVNGIPELQAPNGWTLQWDEGANPLDPDPWNAWVRPESRVLPKAFLPAHEHPTFIWDGEHTVKVFKEYGAISFRLLTTVDLPPGNYLLQVSLFPDLIESYAPDGEKVWAPDPLSGEVRLLADDGGSQWILVQFGRKNTYTYAFTVAEGHAVTLGAAIRGRWAIPNNGWFMDDWRLYRVD